MLASLFHLAVRSLLAVPGSLGSTWLGILFPILATAVGESLGVYKFGWTAMKKNWTMPTLIGLAGLGVAYTLLFVGVELRPSMTIASLCQNKTTPWASN
jgi:hypothetical protein